MGDTDLRHAYDLECRVFFTMERIGHPANHAYSEASPAFRDTKILPVLGRLCTLNRSTKCQLRGVQIWVTNIYVT